MAKTTKKCTMFHRAFFTVRVSLGCWHPSVVFGLEYSTYTLKPLQSAVIVQITNQIMDITRLLASRIY